MTILGIFTDFGTFWRFWGAPQNRQKGVFRAGTWGVQNGDFGGPLQVGLKEGGSPPEGCRPVQIGPSPSGGGPQGPERKASAVIDSSSMSRDALGRPAGFGPASEGGLIIINQVAPACSLITIIITPANFSLTKSYYNNYANKFI